MDALDAPQSKAMGEGWGDFYALTVQNFYRPSSAEKVVFGAWIKDNPAGFRSFRYTEDYPRTYAHIAGMVDYYDSGGVWCAALMQMCRNIRRVLNSDRDGYILALKIVTAGLKKTHAYPSFLDARDMILEAVDDLKIANQLSQPLYESVRRSCWQAFARFGMGFRASSAGAGLDRIVADQSMPPDVMPPDV
jgi:extracellular elastinolytic metalloproteinase